MFNYDNRSFVKEKLIISLKRFKFFYVLQCTYAIGIKHELIKNAHFFFCLNIIHLGTILVFYGNPMGYH